MKAVKKEECLILKNCIDSLEYISGSFRYATLRIHQAQDHQNQTINNGAITYLHANNQNILKLLKHLVENYKKTDVVEIEEEQLPFPELPDGTIHMRVKPGSRISNLLGYAITHFKPDNCKCIVFSGAGNGVTKAITCVEIMNRKFKNIKQVNEIGYRKIEEIWEPISSELGLDSLKVTREIPAIYVLLMKLSPDEAGSEKQNTSVSAVPSIDHPGRKHQQEDKPQYARRSGTTGQRKKGRKQWQDSRTNKEQKLKSQT